MMSKVNHADESPLPGGVEIAPNVRLPQGELRFTFVRSSGPGGQNVNKLSTKARLEVSLAALQEAIGEKNLRRLIALAGPSHVVGEQTLVIVSDESRSQSANRQACLDRLRLWLLEAKKPLKTRRATKPTHGSKRRRLQAKKERSQRKSDRRSPDASP